jgi:hypothetical protein
MSNGITRQITSYVKKSDLPNNQDVEIDEEYDPTESLNGESSSKNKSDEEHIHKKQKSNELA